MKIRVVFVKIRVASAKIRVASVKIRVVEIFALRLVLTKQKFRSTRAKSNYFCVQLVERCLGVSAGDPVRFIGDFFL